MAANPQAAAQRNFNKSSLARREWPVYRVRGSLKLAGKQQAKHPLNSPGWERAARGDKSAGRTWEARRSG